MLSDSFFYLTPYIVRSYRHGVAPGGIHTTVACEPVYLRLDTHALAVGKRGGGALLFALNTVKAGAVPTLVTHMTQGSRQCWRVLRVKLMQTAVTVATRQSGAIDAGPRTPAPYVGVKSWVSQLTLGKPPQDFNVHVIHSSTQVICERT